MSEFVLVVFLANLIILVCMYLLRHVIAIRAPVLFIAVGISVILCILYPFMVAWVSYPKVLYLYAALILAGAGVLYKIENTIFAATDIRRGEMAGVAVGEALAAVEGGPALDVNKGVFQGFVPAISDSMPIEGAGAEVDQETPAVILVEAQEPCGSEAGKVIAESMSMETGLIEEPAGEFATDALYFEPDEIIFIEEIPVEVSEVEAENETGEPAAGAPEFALEEPDWPLAEPERPDVAVEGILEEISASLLHEDAKDDAGEEAPAGFDLEEPETGEYEAGDLLAVVTQEEAEADPFEGLAAAEMPEINTSHYLDPEQEAAGDLAIDQMPGMQRDEKDIGDLVAEAFDSLRTGDRAGAAESFFKALKLNPAPKLAAMLCIEISSIYVAEGRTRQALAVMEMLQDVWGPSLEENDLGRIKTILIQLRREVL